MERPLTSQEAAVVQWLLDNAALADVSAFSTELRVIGCCGCGCYSLNFAPETEGVALIARAAALYEDGKKAGLRLWGHEGKIISLEVIDYDPAAAHPFPDVARLRRHEPG